MITIKLKIPFDLDSTITCGQIFRFKKLDNNSYDIILDDRVINISQNKNILYIDSNIENNLEEKIIDYLDLNTDYENICKILIEKDEKIKSSVEFSKGLKMIHQSPFETIVEYIISANNSVPSISSSMNNIATKYGKKVIFNNKEYYLFPTFKDLKNVKIEDYRNCKVGFRDKYIYEIVQKLNNNEFNIDYINNLNTAEALEYLTKNNGIGPKVASCILLFAYNRFDVFPIDTWVKKIMLDRYNIEGEKNIRKYCLETYGKYCGLAIQYLFNESRNKN